jgi:N-acetylneuraminate synthase
MIEPIRIGEREIGPGNPAYFIAEMSANHNQDLEQALKIVEAAKAAGADAIKTQTYSPDSITMPLKGTGKVLDGTIWEGSDLYDLYVKACMPMEWQAVIKKAAKEAGLDFLSTAFSPKDVAFLEKLEVKAHKTASFELVDIPLIERMASTGKPLIISTGMGTLEEIDEAVQAAKRGGCREMALLKCTSAYPAAPNEMNLRAIPFMSTRYNVPIGISDHTLGTTISVAAVALGANIVEKHLTLSRSTPGPDSQFSVEPSEFKTMVSDIRKVEAAMGEASFEIGELEKKNMIFRRSLFVVMDMRKGERFTEENVKSIRPNFGLQPKYLKDVLGKRAKKDVSKGTPLSWELVE